MLPLCSTLIFAHIAALTPVALEFYAVFPQNYNCFTWNIRISIVSSLIFSYYLGRLAFSAPYLWLSLNYVFDPFLTS